MNLDPEERNVKERKRHQDPAAEHHYPKGASKTAYFAQGSSSSSHGRAYKKERDNARKLKEHELEVNLDTSDTRGQVAAADEARRRGRGKSSTGKEQHDDALSSFLLPVEEVDSMWKNRLPFRLYLDRTGVEQRYEVHAWESQEVALTSLKVMSRLEQAGGENYHHHALVLPGSVSLVKEIALDESLDLPQFLELMFAARVAKAPKNSSLRNSTQIVVPGTTTVSQAHSRKPVCIPGPFRSRDFFPSGGVANELLQNSLFTLGSPMWRMHSRVADQFSSLLLSRRGVRTEDESEPPAAAEEATSPLPLSLSRFVLQLTRTFRSLTLPNDAVRLQFMRGIFSGLNCDPEDDTRNRRGGRQEGSSPTNSQATAAGSGLQLPDFFDTILFGNRRLRRRNESTKSTIGTKYVIYECLAKRAPLRSLMDTLLEAPTSVLVSIATGGGGSASGGASGGAGGAGGEGQGGRCFLLKLMAHTLEEICHRLFPGSWFQTRISRARSQDFGGDRCIWTGKKKPFCDNQENTVQIYKDILLTCRLLGLGRYLTGGNYGMDGWLLPHDDPQIGLRARFFTKGKARCHGYTAPWEKPPHWGDQPREAENHRPRRIPWLNAIKELVIASSQREGKEQRGGKTGGVASPPTTGTKINPAAKEAPLLVENSEEGRSDQEETLFEKLFGPSLTESPTTVTRSIELYQLLIARCLWHILDVKNGKFAETPTWSSKKLRSSNWGKAMVFRAMRHHISLDRAMLHLYFKVSRSKLKEQQQQEEQEEEKEEEGDNGKNRGPYVSYFGRLSYDPITVIFSFLHGEGIGTPPKFYAKLWRKKTSVEGDEKEDKENDNDAAGSGGGKKTTTTMFHFCPRCQRRGHDAAACPNVAGLRCRICRSRGHLSEQCTPRKDEKTGRVIRFGTERDVFAGKSDRRKLKMKLKEEREKAKGAKNWEIKEELRKQRGEEGRKEEDNSDENR